MNITASDRASLLRLASSLPVGDESRRAILAGLKVASFPTSISLSDLDLKGPERLYADVFPTNTRFGQAPSESTSSVFYLDGMGHLFVVLASKKKALLWVAEGYGSKHGRFDVTTAWYLAKERKSLLGCLKENQSNVEHGGQPSWVQVRVSP